MTDSCPRCLRRGVEPYVDAEDFNGNPHTSYGCPACGHTWVTSRIAEPEQGCYATYDDPDAWEAEGVTTYDLHLDAQDPAETAYRQQLQDDPPWAHDQQATADAHAALVARLLAREPRHVVTLTRLTPTDHDDVATGPGRTTG